MMDAVRIAVWGIGAIYREHINTLLAMRALGQIELVAAVDSTPPPVSSLDGIPVLAPDGLASVDFDFLLLMSKNNSEELLESADNLGIPREKVRTYRLLSVPGMDFRSYKRLCESKLSIVSNNCWGDTISRTLQIDCHSPFKSCAFSEEGYLKLLDHLEDYLAIDDLACVDTRIDAQGNRYFSCLLGDVELRLLHEGDFETALGNWKAGRTEFNLDAAFVEFYTVNPNAERAFEALEHYSRRVCFVPYETQLPHSIQLPVFPSYGQFLNSVNEAVGDHGKAIALNLVDLLLGEGDPRRFVLKEVRDG